MKHVRTTTGRIVKRPGSAPEPTLPEEDAAMRIAMQPEGMMERVGMALGMVPRPMGDTWLAHKLARLIMAATRLGLFEALAGGRKTAAEVAAEAGTDSAA